MIKFHICRLSRDAHFWSHHVRRPLDEFREPFHVVSSSTLLVKIKLPMRILKQLPRDSGEEQLVLSRIDACHITSVGSSANRYDYVITCWVPHEPCPIQCLHLCNSIDSTDVLRPMDLSADAESSNAGATASNIWLTLKSHSYVYILDVKVHAFDTSDSRLNVSLRPGSASGKVFVCFAYWGMH